MTTCERCGAGSWTGTVENPVCPYCRRPKHRGSREEMARHIHDLREVCLNAIGWLTPGVSVLTPDTLVARLKKVLKETE